MSKGIKDRVPKATPYHSNNAFGQVFLDLSGPHPERSAEGAAYTVLVKDYYLRMDFIVFLKTKDKATENLSRFLADHNGRPHSVRCVKSDNAT